jgi:hypothetical protein
MKHEATTLLQHIERVVEKTKSKKLSQTNIDSCAEHTACIAGILSLSPMESLLLSVFIDMYNDRSNRREN